VAAAVAVALVVVVVRWRVGDPGSEGPTSRRTVFMGDSITQADTPSFDAEPGEGSWVRYAVADDRTPWTFVANVAMGGQTLAQMAERFERDVLSRDPDGVVIMGGTNDVLQGLPLAPSMASLRSMIERAQDAGAEVWVVGPPPINAFYAKPVGPMAAEQAALAEATGATYVEVAGDTLVGPDGDWLPGLSYDGVHPTPAGAQAIADLVLDELDG
jgi:lysophospholipase L1-like esterase